MDLMKLFDLVEENFGDKVCFMGLTFKTDDGFVTIDVLEDDIYLINFVSLDEKVDGEYFEAKGYLQFMQVMNNYIFQKVGN